MEASEIERELEELETRLERLRALYEQHFMGLEKLEPLIPRKDVDRRIWVLRREQIRNTGLRFKFQMLIQRYNTFQQYWGRILREIENGTYRRDVMRAAKRFGAKEALTILGKRRAKKYADLAAAQEAKRGGAHRGAVVEELPDEYLEEEPPEEEFLGDDDLEEELESASDGGADDLDEAPTPAPSRPAGKPVDRLSWPVVAPSQRGEALRAAAPPPSDPAREERAPPSIPPPRPTDPDAARRRVAELAAQARSTRAEPSVPRAPAGPLELDLDFDSPQTAPKPAFSPRRASTAKMAAQKPPAAGGGAATKAPAQGGPIRRPTQRSIRIRAFIAAQPARFPPEPARSEAPPPAPVAGSGPPEAASPAAPATSHAETPLPVTAATPAPPTAAEPPARSPERARPATAHARPQAGVDRGLEEARLRQIYAKYIDTRRAANEPTAGITFEKLAESLRAQAAKLREAHPVRSIDYDVVVKNGKTLIKPILK